MLNSHQDVAPHTEPSFDQESLVSLRNTERALPKPNVAREFLTFAEGLKAGELTLNKMMNAYNQLVRVVRATTPADTEGYLPVHPVEQLIAEFKSAPGKIGPQEACAQLLVRAAQIAEVNHNNFQVKVSSEYGSAIGQRVGDILFEIELASKSEQRAISNSTGDKIPQLSNY